MSALLEPPALIPLEDIVLEGSLVVPAGATSLVIFAHGSGSSRHSPRNQYVARELQTGGFGTLLIDLLTEEEDREYRVRFDIGLLSRRLEAVTEWVHDQDEMRMLQIGYFGASTGAAAALKAAAVLESEIGAVVSRGGRPDLAEVELPFVKAPTLLIVGSMDDFVLELNRQALEALTVPKKLHVVPHATHLFEEPGTLEEVALVSRDWFATHLSPVPILAV